MENSEKRIIGSLILLAGITLLSIALYSGQIAEVAEFVRSVFEPAVAGLPAS
ncbi:MAG: hypothetical protein JSW72_04615 [Candidatus Bathyarchaeota archaeon]|nr:MAG: hypothetical protein JSW72_04615 [Candidatus Bathyarchaeota archaeon]